MVFERNLSTKIRLRDLQLPEGYRHIAALFNSIEPDSATVEALEEEDRHIPQKSTLTLDDNGLLIGFGRIRVLAEKKLYDLYVETSKDNPGQSGNLPAFPQWRKEALPEDCSQEKWVFIALDGDVFRWSLHPIQYRRDRGPVYGLYRGETRLSRPRNCQSFKTPFHSGSH